MSFELTVTPDPSPILPILFENLEWTDRHSCSFGANPGLHAAVCELGQDGKASR